jgi:hypothetical protein
MNAIVLGLMVSLFTFGCATTEIATNKAPVPDRESRPLPPVTAAPQRVWVHANYQATVHQFPAGKRSPVNFAIAPPGLVLVPLHGGVFLAGWNGWLIEPSTTIIQSVATGSDGHLYFITATEQGHAITWRRGGVWSADEQVLATLPLGVYHLLTADGHGVWIWGRTQDGMWMIAHVRAGDTLRSVYSDSKPITALALAGRDALVAAMRDGIVLLRPGQPPVRLAHVRGVVDGLAVDQGGEIYASTLEGIVKLTKAGRLEPVASGLHGPLHWSMGNLYVLVREQHRVVQLRPPHP